MCLKSSIRIAIEFFLYLQLNLFEIDIANILYLLELL